MGIPVYGTGKVRVGLLDYPFLAVVIVPLMLVPIVLRIAANLSDLRRQNFSSRVPHLFPHLKFQKQLVDQN